MTISHRAIRDREAARDRASGRFGHQQHTAPEMMRRLDRGDGFDELTPYQLRRLAERRISDIAAAFAARRQLNAEQRADMTQEAIAQFLDRCRAHAAKQNTRFDPARDMWRAVFTRGGLLRQMFNSTAQWTQLGGRDNVHHTDIRAFAELQRLEQEHAGRLGRGLTTRERDELADRIRLAEPPSRRPTIGFHKRLLANDSLDRQLGDDGSGFTLADTLDGGDPYPDVDRALDDTVFTDRSLLDADPGHDPDADHDALERYRRDLADYEQTPTAQRGRRPARSDYGLTAASGWRLLAEQRDGLPAARAGHLDRAASRAARAAVDSYPGGAARLAADYRNGDIPEHVAEPLFAPFGPIGNDQRDAVAAALADHPGYADRLWRVAVDDATATRSRT